MAAKDPKPLPSISQKDIQRFWSKVDKSPGQGPKGDCWEWTGHRQHRGYGEFTIRFRNLRASRVAYFISTGEDPWPFNTCHRCDWPPCCKPAHLFKGTSQDNIDDKISKGREARGKAHGRYTQPENTARGDRNGMRAHPESVLRGEMAATAILTEEKVREARLLRRLGRTQQQVAAILGVSRGAIRDIDVGKTWKHVGD